MKNQEKIHKDKYRLYGLVPYNLSPIQQAIQYGHALQEYNNMLIHYKEMSMEKMGEDSLDITQEIKAFDQWRKNDKTFIILNGGTSNSGDSNWPQGTMETHMETLKENKVKFATFNEPDLNFMLSGIVFLVPEQVYKKYDKGDNTPFWLDFRPWLTEKLNLEGNDDIKLQTLKLAERNEGKSIEEIKPEEYKEWVEYMGGEKNVFLRQFLAQFRLA